MHWHCMPLAKVSSGFHIPSSSLCSLRSFAAKMILTGLGGFLLAAKERKERIEKQDQGSGD